MTDEFALEPSTSDGNIPQRVVDELVRGKQESSDYAKAFGDAVKAQAEKHKIKPGALRKYVAALAADKKADVAAETEQLAHLLES